MINWYDGSASFVDLDEQLSQARRLARNDQLEDAMWELIRGLHNVHADEKSWQRAASSLLELFDQAGHAEEALTLAWYLDEPALMNPLMNRVSATDRARTWSGQAGLGLVPEAARATLYRRAAVEFEGAGRLVHAAINYERAGKTEAARALWSRLAGQLTTQGQAYAAGLALFNLARTCQALRQEEPARAATVSAVHQLEAAADHFESIGQRERAFDCYHVLIAIGDLTQSFEHVLEGSVNAIRILRQDKLKHHALRLYQESSERAQKRGEYFAAASLAREMTEYARAQALDQVAEYALFEEARLWQKLAQTERERQAPSQLAEAALEQCLLANAELHQYASVAELYAVLEQLGDNAKQPRFTRARERYAGAKNQGSPPAVSGLGKPHAPPEVWFDDLVEWEDAGSANARCAAIILDAEGVDDRTTRRCAVLGRLAALALDKADEATDFALEVLANHLAPIGLYQVLPALEVLSEHPASRVRIAALRALGRHSYKRSFLSLERAIDDQDQNVKDAAVEEIRRQRFDHAFQPLARIYGQSAYGPARLAALQALAHLELNEAHELLLAALEHGTPAEVDAATEALTRTQSQSFVHTARALLPNARPRLKQAIHKILRARGEAP